ncbi:hypothetical protein DFO67_108142 [Modicisalibacter xianhensis]|uniref:Uncharacterized protein n=1 Tax=Modicisalibacter xianhensis TaxID=442341 RepID=A0A4V3GU62_9GAMM|nr:hypothetical protein [Halomonas xianhensis]TDX29098.1 hypothetical protein DFO67_108142 [Halomonas xianhensis]
MPSINLGRVRFNWLGQYDPLVAYQEYDCVEDDGQSYVCIAPVTGTGPNDTGGGTYWGSMLIRSADYNQARQDAIDAAEAAQGSATAAGTSETNAGNSATAAGASATKADRWANEAEDVEVEPGKFSAFHFAQKAAAFGDPNQFDITADQTTDTRTLAQWTAQTKSNQAGLDGHLNAADPHNQYFNQSRGDVRYAKLSGANDFDTMPTVGGSPIVESGSNSDGEWWRSSDGIAHCRRLRTYPSPGGTDMGYVTWNLPISFVSGNLPAAFLSVGATSGSGIRCERQWLLVNLNGTVTCRYVFESAVATSFDVQECLMASGRWK